MPYSRGLARLLALACGVTIASIYYAQPLLHVIAGSFGASPPAAGLVVTAAQAGFAAGLLLLVPLGDITARRPLFTALLIGAEPGRPAVEPDVRLGWALPGSAPARR